jgi:hypothetical protein
MGRRQRLVCFYCGTRSADAYERGVRKWTCAHCDADNHLDEVNTLFCRNEPFFYRTFLNSANDLYNRMAKLSTMFQKRQVSQFSLHSLSRVRHQVHKMGSFAILV